jgi:hypothetical protein
MGKQETCENRRPFGNLNGDCTQTMNVGAQKSQKDHDASLNQLYVCPMLINYSSSFLSREPKPRQKDKISCSTLSRPSTTIQWARLIEE